MGREIPKSLADKDIVTKRKIGRRSALGLIAGGTLSLAPGMARGQAREIDEDTTTVGDIADEDVGNTADPGDMDRSAVADEKEENGSDIADIDIASRGDPIPAIDIDPSDSGGDADLSARGDGSDQD